ncbi:TetR/AcrR family transcriptional regulator [Marininema halotolerans]|uniref:DNA-binding transcriptional regulator, AcrR family n=1 Tax=Marininema halotolerans TaxID=1155944 RepID=A0A1I6R8W3_9BACL|nr:TetR/AcrR family transcriptional regulator [Marininema halotolerans]SFS61125.1 DNA-binding transcriptional regulator, AcrR family [Marininema halotolerans]
MSTKYEEILVVTYRLFAEVGIEKTSMSRIAKELGISKPAIYYYFPSKGALINTLFDFLMKEIQFQNFFNQEEYTPHNIRQKLIVDGHAMIKQQAADPHYEKVMSEYYALSAKETKFAIELKHVLHIYLEGFTRLLELAVAADLIDRKDVHLRAQFLTLIVDGLDKYTDKEYNVDPSEIWTFAVHSALKN